MEVPPPCSQGLLGLLGGGDRQACGTSERAPPWAHDILDLWRGGPTSTNDLDYRLLEAGRRLMQAITSHAAGSLGEYGESADLSQRCLGRRAVAANPR